MATKSAEAEFAKQQLARVQHRSFAKNREYCGYLARNRNGRLVATRMARGLKNGCTPPRPKTGMRLIASLHTHGAYDPRVPAEFPTTLDMRSDIAEGVNGYIATPGGRFWYIDSRQLRATQLCELACLPQDPRFRAGDDGIIKMRYSYEELLTIENPK